LYEDEDPTYERGSDDIWLIPSLVPRLSPSVFGESLGTRPADTSGFINVDYFLERNFSPPITL